VESRCPGCHTATAAGLRTLREACGRAGGRVGRGGDNIHPNAEIEAVKKNIVLTASVLLNVLLAGALVWGWGWTRGTLFRGAADANRADAAYKAELVEALGDRDPERLNELRGRLQRELDTAKANAAAFASVSR
jgi:hypothetical protein